MQRLINEAPQPSVKIGTYDARTGLVGSVAKQPRARLCTQLTRVEFIFTPNPNALSLS